MQTQLDSNVNTQAQSEKKLRYPSIPLKLDKQAIALRGRQLFIDYRITPQGMTTRRTTVCPLQDRDSLATGTSRIQSLLLANKLGLSQVVSFSTNHGEHKEIIDTMNRKAYAASH